MANIKFSQFTVGNVESDIDFVVGYKGGDNIQISPANLLSASLSGYLPLTGGTMTGNIKYNSGVRAQFGTGGNSEIFYTGTNFVMSAFTGDMILTNYANDKDIIFQSDDGSGGTTQYFRLDGGYSLPYTIFPNNSTLALGSDLDLRILHNGTDSFIDQTGTGNLYIRQKNDDKDIILESDNGSGGTTEYFRLDGSIANAGTVYTRFPDNSRAVFGTSFDLQVYHDASNSYIKHINSGTGDLIIQQERDDGDIIFNCDDGSGGIAEYFRLDGGDVKTMVFETMEFQDNVKLAIGNSEDLIIDHNATDSRITNYTGNLYIINSSDDSDIVFQCDDGAGGLTTYFLLDGSQTQTRFEKGAQFGDNVTAKFGSGGDSRIFHDATNTYFDNFTGDFYLRNYADDKDIIFQCDDGAGGLTEYFKLDGSAVFTRFSKDVRISDNIQLQVGDSADLKIYHNGTASVVSTTNGDLSIINYANDSDIKFFSDDGSGGVAEYFRVDGGAEAIIISKNVQHADNVRAYFGNAIDLAIYHNGTASFINNETGDLNIANYANDSDIRFYNDDGAGSVTEYFRLDGGDEQIKISKTLKFFDNIPAWFGDANDLRIYHDGSNSYITDNGTGNLNIQGDNLLLKRADGSQTYLQALTGSSVSLYHAGNKKLETKSTGINIQSVPTYADNAAAIAGGLTTGDVYRTGDLLKIVH